MQGDWDDSLVEGLSKMESIFVKLNQGVEMVCNWWNEFFKKYKINMIVLKDMYTVKSEEENPLCTDILNFLDGTDSLVPHHFMKFLMKELFNNKILSSLDEKADTFNHNIQNELQDNLIPLSEELLTIFQNLNNQVYSKKEHGQQFLGLHDTQALVE